MIFFHQIVLYVSELIFEKEYQKLIMTTDDKIRGEKLQYDINREVAKISDWSSGKINKYEYLTGEEILPYNQRQIIEQANVTSCLLWKVFKNQTKTNKERGRK